MPGFGLGSTEPRHSFLDSLQALPIVNTPYLSRSAPLHLVYYRRTVDSKLGLSLVPLPLLHSFDVNAVGC